MRPRPQRARARDRRSGRTRLQQLAARRGARERGRAAQRGARAARLAHRDVGARSGVPAGGALAVDRERFSRGAWRRASRPSRAFACTARRSGEIPRDRAAIVACGPLPSPAFLERHRRPARTRSPRGRRRAAALLRCGVADRCRRLDRRNADVPQVALRQGRRRRLSQHPARPRRLRAARCTTCARSSVTPRRTSRTATRRTSRAACRSKRWPTAATTRCASGRSSRSDCAIRARAGCRTPWFSCAKRTREGTAFNLVGFQTRLDVAGAKGGVRKAPGPGASRMAAPRRHAPQHVHRFAAAARRAAACCAARRALYFAGQITGAEGYVEAAACGAMTGIHARARCAGLAAGRVSARERVRRRRRAPAEPRTRPIFSRRTSRGRPSPPLGERRSG